MTIEVVQLTDKYDEWKDSQGTKLIEAVQELKDEFIEDKGGLYFEKEQKFVKDVCNLLGVDVMDIELYKIDNQRLTRYVEQYETKLIENGLMGEQDVHAVQNAR